ncbi:hypothetical protein QBC43DRAFT_355990 [Cladorrhinum sp. PSN259]|nr:hypothetical protein QBC43DRAFT_355990 [Cladorrhinum sp. PSN259]
MASPSVAAEESADRKSPIEMNINLNYGNEISGGTPTSPNPDIHVEKLLMGVSITTEKSPTIADCPPTYADGDRAPPVEPPGPFVSSGHPPNPPGPFVSSGPPSGGNRGNNAPPRAVTITQTVTAAPAGGGLGSSSFGAGAGAGGYNYRSGQGGGGSSSGSYGAGAGNGPGNGGYGGGGSPAYGPPGGSNNGQVLTIIQTTTACLNSDNSNRNGNGYGSGNEGSPPCPSGNVNSGACSSQPAMSGPFVETVFIMGTPSPLAIVPTTCRSSGNGSNDLPPYPAPAPVAATAPCLEPPPPPPPPPSAPAPLPAVVTVTQRVAAPQPPSPPPAPLAYSPTNSVAYFGAKGVGTELEVTASTASFSTVTLTVPAGSQQNEQLPDIGDYGGPGSSGGGVSPVNGDPGDNGGVGPANGSGVAPISAIPPSAWGGGGVSPAQVTASRAIQDGPSLSILFYTLFLPSFQILLLSC